jgi:hypothetical protein
MSRRLPFLLCAAVVCGAGLGCNKEQDGISQYDVPKPDVVFRENNTDPGSPFARENVEQPAPKPGPKERMLGAIIPHGRKMWFFKLQGAGAEVGAVTEAFASFIRSVQFKQGSPTWKLPKDWKQLPDDDPRNAPKGQFGFPRFATILVAPADESLELQVTSLGNQPERESQFILMNVNRWRGQLGLRPRRLTNLYDGKSDAADAEKTDEVKKFTINGNTVVLVQFVGTPQKRRPGTPPFMHP